MKCISLQSGLLLLPFSILLFLSLEREPHLFFVFRCKYRHLQLKNVREYRTNKIQSSQPLTFMKNKWKTKSTLCCSSQAKYFKDEKVMARVWWFLKIKACFVYLLCNCCDCFASVSVNQWNSHLFHRKNVKGSHTSFFLSSFAYPHLVILYHTDNKRYRYIFVSFLLSFERLHLFVCAW